MIYVKSFKFNLTVVDSKTLDPIEPEENYTWGEQFPESIHLFDFQSKMIDVFRTGLLDFDRVDSLDDFMILLSGYCAHVIRKQNPSPRGVVSLTGGPAPATPIDLSYPYFIRLCSVGRTDHPEDKALEMRLSMVLEEKLLSEM